MLFILRVHYKETDNLGALYKILFSDNFIVLTIWA